MIAYSLMKEATVAAWIMQTVWSVKIDVEVETSTENVSDIERFEYPVKQHSVRWSGAIW